MPVLVLPVTRAAVLRPPVVASSPLAGVTFAADTLDDTDGVLISAHTASDGGSWTRNTGSGGTSAPRFFSNRVRNSENQKHGWYHSAVPAQANYEITGKVRVVTSATSARCGPFLMDVTNALNGYVLAPNFSGTQGFILYLVDTGTLTALSTYAVTVNSGTTYTLKLRRNGSALDGYVDGVLRCSATDSTYTANGRVGMFIEGTANDAANQHFEELTSAVYL